MSGIPSTISPEDFPLVLNPCGGSNSSMLAGVAGANPNGGGSTAGSPGARSTSGASPMGSPGHLQHGHISVRDSMGSTGPIRNKSRIDTSPYGSDRYSQGGYHLSPPDPSWRRVHSDSSIHRSSSAGSGQNQGGAAAAAAAAAGGHLNHNGGGISPLQGASPTTNRRGEDIV